MRFLIPLFIISFLSLSVLAQVDQDVLDQAEFNDVKVIITLKEGRPVNLATATREGVEKKLNQIKESNNDKVKNVLQTNDVSISDERKVYNLIPAVAGTFTKQEIEKLMQDPSVDRIVLDRPVHGTLNESVGIINVSRVWNATLNGVSINGSGQTVCILDTGVDTSNSFLPNFIGGYDFVHSDNDPVDDHGHGTHVAGIIASRHQTYKGVASGVNFIMHKVLDNTGGGSFSNVDAGLQACINNASIYNISVISLSLGTIDYHNAGACDSTFPSTSAIINSARAAGIAVVVSSGNEANNSGISAPACISNVTAVGATTKSDVVASYSNSAGNIDLLAPGSNIISLKNGGGTESRSGTSMAAPHVSAAIALLQQYSNFSVDAVESLLQSTGVLINDTDNGIVKARINVLAALATLDSDVPRITFVSPTPENGSNASNPVTIKVSLSEGAEVYLELDGNNISMIRNGLFYSSSLNLSFGNYSYRVHAIDMVGNSNFTGFRSMIILNSAPIINSYIPSNLTSFVVENSSLFFNFSASDADGDNLSNFWYLDGELNSTSQFFTYSPNLTESGSHVVVLVVNDSQSNDTLSWNVTVTNLNRVPLIDFHLPANFSFNISENSTVMFSHNSSDLDGDFLTSSWFVDDVYQGNSSNFNYTPSFSSSGLRVVKLVVSDSQDNTSLEWNVTVTNVNVAPDFVLLTPMNGHVELGNLTVFQVNQTDPDADISSYFWNFGFLNSSSATPSYTYNTKGLFNLSVTISDSVFNTTKTFEINVSDTQGPTVSSISYSSQVILGNSQHVQLSLTDFTNVSNASLTFNGTLQNNILNSSTNYDWSFSPVIAGNFTILALDTLSNQRSLTYTFTFTTCGDNVCQSEESCSSCNSDCGSCSSSSSGGGGGGGSSTTSSSSAVTSVYVIGSVQPNVRANVEVKKSDVSVSKISFTPTTSVSDVRILVKSVNSPVENLTNGYQYFEVTLKNIIDSQISDGSFRFSVPKAWLISEAIDPETVSLSRYSGGWQKLSTVMLGSNSTEYKYQASTPGFSVFGISGENNPILAPVVEETPKSISKPVVTGNSVAEPKEPPKAEETKSLPMVNWTQTSLVIGTILSTLLILHALFRRGGFARGEKSKKKVHRKKSKRNSSK